MKFALGLSLALGLLSCSGDAASEFDNLSYSPLTDAQKTTVKTVSSETAVSLHAVLEVATKKHLLQKELGLASEEDTLTDLQDLLAAGNCVQTYSCGADNCYDLQEPGTHAITYSYKGSTCPVEIDIVTELTVTGESPKTSYAFKTSKVSYTALTDAYKAKSEIVSITISGEATASAEKDVTSTGNGMATGTIETKSSGSLAFRAKSNATVVNENGTIKGTGTAEFILKFGDFNFKAEVIGTDVAKPTATADPFVYKINEVAVTRAEFEALAGTYYAGEIDDLYPFEFKIDHHGDSWSDLGDGLVTALDP